MKKKIDGSKLIDKNSSDDKVQSDNKPDFKILAQKKVAEILGVHPITVTRLAKSGQLKNYLIGRRMMFKDIDVWSFFENQVDRGYVFGEEL